MASRPFPQSDMVFSVTYLEICIFSLLFAQLLLLGANCFHFCLDLGAKIVALSDKFRVYDVVVVDLVS
jgi:hypothetical protein